MKKTLLAILALAAIAFLATDSRAAGVTTETDVVPANATLSTNGGVGTFVLQWTNQAINCGTFAFGGTGGLTTAGAAAGAPCPAGISANATVTLSQQQSGASQPITITIKDVGGFGGAGIVTLSNASAPGAAFALTLGLQTGDGPEILGTAFLPLAKTTSISIVPSLAQLITSLSLDSTSTTTATDLPDGVYAGSFDVTFSR